MDIQKIMAQLEAKHPGEKEYLQAVHEVLISIEDVYNRHPEFERAKLIERLVEAGTHHCVQSSLGGRQGRGSGQLGLPGTVQQCHRPV